jgi:hypothetical protein
MAVPDPTQVAPWYLRNINQALELDEATGNVFVRTNAVLIGNVSVGNISIGALGNLDLSGNSLPVVVNSGNVNAVVSGTVAATQSGSWTVNIQDAGNSITIDGSVSVTGNIAGITGNVTVIQGTSPWVVTGNTNVAITSGNVGITGNLAGITGNVTVVDGGGSLTVDGNVNATITGGNVATTIGGTNLDAFGRLRVSNPFTLFDSQNRYIDGDQFSNITATGGNVVYVANESSFNLNVSATSGSSVIRQSKTVQAYQPGKSLLIMNTFAMATLKANCRQRVGYFTADNGIYFEAVGTTLNLVIRSSTTGSIVEERIPQSSWNGDRLNGTGASGITLDPTLTQIFWCDVEWLGVGNVRTGFVINGVFIVCHTFQHANQPGNTTVYMTTATLNPRYEITNTGATSGVSTMKQICSTVISEGGFAPSTKLGYVTNNTTATRISSANTVTALCSIRLNPAYPDAVVLPSQLDILSLDVRYGQFQLIENATFTASFSNVAGSVVQTAIHSNVITDGTVVYAGLSSSRDEVEISEDIKRRLQLWRTAAGNTSTLTLAVAYTSANADLLWKLGWEELTN